MITLSHTELRETMWEPDGYLWCCGCNSYVPEADTCEHTGECFVCSFHKLGFPLNCWSIKTQDHNPLVGFWSTRMNYEDGEYSFEIFTTGDTRQESIDNAHAVAYEDAQRELDLAAGHWGRLCYSDDAKDHTWRW